MVPEFPTPSHQIGPFDVLDRDDEVRHADRRKAGWTLARSGPDAPDQLRGRKIGQVQLGQLRLRADSGS